MQFKAIRPLPLSAIIAGFLGALVGFGGSAHAFDPAPVCAYPTSAGPTWEPEPPTVQRLVPSTPGPMCALSVPGIAVEAPIAHEAARRALARARELAARGDRSHAILRLRVVAEAVPDLADRIALEEAEIRMAGGADRLACDAYRRATESPQRTVEVRAEIGLARCLLTIGDHDGVALFDSLRRRYPELPQEQELDLLLGLAHETWGEREEAGRIYRVLDLTQPGSPYAARARERIDALVADGVAVRDLSVLQLADRAERLVSSGPMDLARAEVERLRAMTLPRTVAAQVARSAARIARVEGRWEDASRLLREAQGLPDLDDEERAEMDDRIQDLDRAAESRELDDVRRRLRQITGGRSIARQPTARLFTVLRVAARAGLRDEVDQAVDAILHRDRVPPGLLFDAGILAAGTGDDAKVEVLFRSARNHPTYGVAARYHHARTLERLGRLTEARAEYVDVISSDSHQLPYYAMWARQRLRAVAPPATPVVREPMANAPVERVPPAQVACAIGPFTPMTERASAKAGQGNRADDVTCTLPAPPVRSAETVVPSEVGTVGLDGIAEAEAAAEALELAGEPRPDARLTNEQMVALLAPLVEAHGEAFPWLGRALQLIELGELEAATDELHETFVAWRDASSGGSLRAGFEGVLRGAAPPRHRVSMETWRERRRFPVEARRVLARVSAGLGEYGMAIRLGGFGVTGAHPRAYEEIVRAAAARHGIEPELLFAVMRVESVYNPRIISYAGAIGLMQIMPRTGRLIAHATGRDEFTVDELLDPETNIELAAWYLSSLIERFDGRLPLAIASYNGGPHNVRRWMRDCSPDMPLDAFLERIEFEQTHRYVRRVLTHYEAYLAQRDEGIAPLDVTLPDLDADTVAF